jgi:hypothetical protein
MKERVTHWRCPEIIPGGWFAKLASTGGSWWA